MSLHYLQDTTGLGLFLGLISMLCYYFMGRMLERQWGVLRFNLYYLTGVVLMDIAALLIGCSATTTYLNASLFLAIATIMPDARFLLFYIIPVKAKYLAWVDILLTAWGIVTSPLRCIGLGILTFRMTLFCLFPLLAVANYFLFFGKEAANLLPDFLRYRKTQTQKNFRAKAARGRIPTGQAITAAPPARGPTGTSAPSAAGRIRSIPIWNSATAPAVRAITAIARTISITTSTFNNVF